MTTPPNCLKKSMKGFLMSMIGPTISNSCQIARHWFSFYFTETNQPLTYRGKAFITWMNENMPLYARCINSFHIHWMKPETMTRAQSNETVTITHKFKSCHLGVHLRHSNLGGHRYRPYSENERSRYSIRVTKF